ncbi:MAG: cytochrome c biogenesis protein CcsA [Phycisphaerae bacterium]|nr:cytochrome c biogenesis protein CcsA [Phycisphaerae bacterium]
MGILVAAFAAAVLGYLLRVREDVRIRRSLRIVVAWMSGLAGILLVFRAAAIRGFPLTGIFESMIFLLILLGITFIWSSLFLHHAWFASGMAWGLLVLVVLAATVAGPASTLQKEAQTPWIAIHALSMIIAGVLIVFSAVIAVLWLYSSRRLKDKRISALFGKMPSLDKLEALNLLGLQFSFVALSIGLFTGIVLAIVKSSSLNMTIHDWITDSKIVMTLLAWLIMLLTLLLKYGLGVRGKALARMTLIVCFFLVFAFIGSTLLCKSGHDFQGPPILTPEEA